MSAIPYHIKLLRFRLLKWYKCTTYPSIKMQQSRGHGTDSEMWQEDLFDKIFRFWREHSFRLLDATHLLDKTPVTGLSARRLPRTRQFRKNFRNACLRSTSSFAPDVAPKLYHYHQFEYFQTFSHSKSLKQSVEGSELCISRHPCYSPHFPWKPFCSL